MSLLLHAPRPRHVARPHPGCMLELDTLGANEFINVAKHLSAPDVVLKPRELHLAFNWGPLKSRNYSRFRRVKLPPARPSKKLTEILSRSNTISSVTSMTMTLTSDVGVLITRPVRRETTYIVWGAIMAVDSPTSTVPPRNVIVKIAVDEEGADDLREDARLHEHLVERGLTLGYYGIFTDNIGSIALVIDDDGELTDVETPTSVSSS